MSTRIYKPLGTIGLIPKSTDGVVGTTLDAKKYMCRTGVQRVKRILFGGTADHEQSFVSDELKKIQTEKSVMWNYDFINERTLDPEGQFIWEPATPRKADHPVKRRPLSNSSLLYPSVGTATAASDFDCDELYPQPVSLIKPKPIKPKTCEMVRSPQQQRLITDFMSVKKRSSSAFSSKADWNIENRPEKIPKLSSDFR